MSNDKKYNLSVSPMWQTQSGGYKSLKINDEILEALSQLKPGGMLIIKQLPNERRKNENSPNAYLEYVSPEAIEEFKAKRAGQEDSL